MSERRLDVAESRRAFGSGEMKTPLPPLTAVEGSWGYGPPGLVIERMQALEARRRARLARWQVPRV